MRKRVATNLLASFFLLFVIQNLSEAQVIYHSVDHVDIYDFLDEMASQGIIELNSAIKPYSRKLIAEKLRESQRKSRELNHRQREELRFYLADFMKEWSEDQDSLRRDLLYRRDSNFSMTLNPIIIASGWKVDDKTFYHRASGAELQGFIDRVGIQFRLSDHHESLRISGPQFLTQRKGALYKSSSDEGADFSQMRGGMSYSWSWGSVGLMRENMVWGNANNGTNIFSSRAPTYTRIMLHLAPRDWIELNYSHGFLASGVLDSLRSYRAGVHERNVFVPKFVAANMLTVKPLKGLFISAGNSVIYSDYINPGFMIPFMFFKSIDHQSYYGGGNFGGQNSQMYIDVSSRQIKRVHLYATLFVDEISFGRMWDKSQHSNFLSLKEGLRWSNMFNRNISVVVEHTRTNAIVYRHFVNTTTFASNGYTLGHYLGDNAQELYFSVTYRPVSRLRISMDYVSASKGTEYPYTGSNGTGLGLPFLAIVDWDIKRFQFSSNYELLNDVLLNFSIGHSTVANNPNVMYDYTPGNVNPSGLSLSAGFNIGF